MPLFKKLSRIFLTSCRKCTHILIYIFKYHYFFISSCPEGFGHEKLYVTNHILYSNYVLYILKSVLLKCLVLK